MSTRTVNIDFQAIIGPKKLTLKRVTSYSFVKFQQAMTGKHVSVSLLCMIPFLGITQPAIITAPSAQEYLGQFQYFRTWTDKRRLIVVHGKDADLDRMLQDAIYQYRCDLATRNINIGNIILNLWKVRTLSWKLNVLVEMSCS